MDCFKFKKEDLLIRLMSLLEEYKVPLLERLSSPRSRSGILKINSQYLESFGA